MNQTLAFLITLFVGFLSVQAQINYDDEFPKYYMETEDTFERLKELPKDTLLDTVFVSDLDAFFKQHFQRDINLKTLAEKFEHYKASLDSLNKLSGQRLYYNFFLRNDTARHISNSFIVKEFHITEQLDHHSLRFSEDDIEDPASISREMLFRCDDAQITDRFLHNPEAMLKTISLLFTAMQQDTSRIHAINLYFPDFSFREKRPMAQFVKSVRIMMDASERFKFGRTRLNVIFHARKGMERNIDRDFQYCLLLEATDVIFVDGIDIYNDYLTKADRMTNQEMQDIGFFAQLISHIYVARHYHGPIDINQLNLTDFSESNIREVIRADYLENNWEIYFYILIGVLFIVLIFTLLYYIYLPFSTLVNENMESVVLISVVLLLEVMALTISIFQHMCIADTFTTIAQNPVLIFSLPLVVVLIVPILYGLSKKRRIP